MSSADSPRVESFVLRFVQDVPSGGASPWRAVVVHVQTNGEKSFTDFVDAVAFISRYVPIGEFSFHATKEGGPTTEDFRLRSSVIGQSGE